MKIRNGAKIGANLKIRKPNDYVVRTGTDAVIQGTNEQQVTLTVATQKGVDIEFSSEELTLEIDDLAERVISPMVNVLAGGVASDVMSLAESFPNIVNNTASGVNAVGAATISPTQATWLKAGALLSSFSTPLDRRRVIVHPSTEATTVSTLAGLFNSAPKIASQFSTGLVGMDVLGADWFSDQVVINHTCGAYTNTISNVNGANQTGTSLIVDALAGPLAVGDIITIDGVNSVNKVTKADNGTLATFVVTAAANTSATTIHIYPPITPFVTPVSGLQSAVAYQTVTVSPDDEANITSPVLSGSTYRKNFMFHPTAVTLVTADLPTWGKGVVDSSRQVYDNISMRMTQAYTILTDQLVTRLDILYGYVSPRPEFAVVVTDVVQ